jgi:hypothetical protein
MAVVVELQTKIIPVLVLLEVAAAVDVVVAAPAPVVLEILLQQVHLKVMLEEQVQVLLITPVVAVVELAL